MLPVEISKMIGAAFTVRNASDYDDMFIASKADTEAQIKNAAFVINEVEKYINTLL